MSTKKSLGLPGRLELTHPPFSYPVRLNLTRYHGVLAPNHRWRGLVTPAKRGKGVKTIADMEVRSPDEHHTAMAWAQRLKRVFNIDIGVCGRCGGSARVVACIEEIYSRQPFYLYYT